MSDTSAARRTRRVPQLLRLLQRGPIDVAALAAELKVSRRTIFRDLRILQSMGVAYRFDPKDEGYQIERSPFLPALNLSIEEALALLLVLRKVVRRPHLPWVQPLLQAAAKVEALLSDELKEHCGSLLEDVEFHWPPTATESDLDSRLRQLQESRAGRKPLRMRYRSVFERSEITTVLSPHRLAFVGRAWYVFGHSSTHHQVRTFKLARIASLEPCDEPFVVAAPRSNDKPRPWSLIPEGQEYQVKLRFTPKVASNVAEVLWHPAQRLTQREDGSLIYELRVDGVREISWWVLGYGAEVEVLEPEELRDLVRQMSARMMDLYARREPGLEGATETAAHRRRRRPTDVAGNQ